MLTPESLQEHRAALTGLCYRMLGSAVDADDALQETLIRAWRGIERFDSRASLRTWLCRIATNVCLDALADRSHRVRPMEDGPVGSVDDQLLEHPRTQSIRLAFVAALQHLRPNSGPPSS